MLRAIASVTGRFQALAGGTLQVLAGRPARPARKPPHTCPTLALSRKAYGTLRLCLMHRKDIIDKRYPHHSTARTEVLDDLFRLGTEAGINNAELHGPNACLPVKTAQ
jgi:hypothetical protein